MKECFWSYYPMNAVQYLHQRADEGPMRACTMFLNINWIYFLLCYSWGHLLRYRCWFRPYQGECWEMSRWTEARWLLLQLDQLSSYQCVGDVRATRNGTRLNFTHILVHVSLIILYGFLLSSESGELFSPNFYSYDINDCFHFLRKTFTTVYTALYYCAQLKLMLLLRFKTTVIYLRS